MTTLLKYIALATYRSPDEVNPFTLFETIATLCSILRTVAMELNLQPNPVQLPSDTPVLRKNCSPSAQVGQNGVIEEEMVLGSS